MRRKQKVRSANIWMSIAACVVGLSLAGCGASVHSAGEVEKIHGKVVTADGKPIPNVLLVLQPTESGYVTELEVDKEGEFTGEAISGKYVFYLNPSKVSKKPLPKTIPASFSEPKMENRIDVKHGQEIVCLIK